MCPPLLPVQPAAMLPLIDMANHSFQPNARIAPGPSGSMCMVAIRCVGAPQSCVEARKGPQCGLLCALNALGPGFVGRRGLPASLHSSGADWNSSAFPPPACTTNCRELEAGEPVLLSYGPLSNDFLLLDYGFVVPRNPHDTVQLRFDRGLVEVSETEGMALLAWPGLHCCLALSQCV